MKTVAELREEGYKVGVTHSRAYTWEDKKNEADISADDVFFMSRRAFIASFEELEDDAPRLLQNRGETKVTLTTPDGVTVEGYSRCWFRDSYDRKMGVKIALGRALKALEAAEGSIEENTLH